MLGIILFLNVREKINKISQRVSSLIINVKQATKHKTQLHG